MTRVEHIGRATLYLGDCHDIVPTLGDISCVVTSPPYNQLGGEKLASKPTGMWAESKFGHTVTGGWCDAGYTDNLTEDEYQRQQLDLFGAIAVVCRDDASLFYNHQLRWRDGECLHPIQWFRPTDWRLRSEVIWARGGGMMLNARMFCRSDERVIWFVRGRKWKWNQDQVGLGTVWQIAPATNKDHPVAFPTEMPKRCIMATTDPGDIVLDPYSGSASTGVAAVQNGRRYIGIEREEKWFDLACRRIEDDQRQGDFFVGEAA